MLKSKISNLVEEYPSNNEILAILEAKNSGICNTDEINEINSILNN